MRYTQPNDSPTDAAWVTAKQLKEDMGGGLIFVREVRYLYTAAQRVGSGSYADLGTFKGLSSAALAKGITDAGVEAIVYSFDTFEGHGLSPRNTEEPNSVELVESKLENLGVFDKVLLVPGFFEDSAPLFTPEFFSFMFIDGSHDYDSVLQDFKTWAPLLKKGGELAFHDATHSPGVKRLMTEIEYGSFGIWEKVAIERTIMSWIKR